MMSVRELGMSEHRDALAWAEAQVAAYARRSGRAFLP
jgi:hypothetical protein